MKNCFLVILNKMYCFSQSVSVSYTSVPSQGFDPYEKTRFAPRHKRKGRSSTGNILKRKKKVAHEEKRVSPRMRIRQQSPMYCHCPFTPMVTFAYLCNTTRETRGGGGTESTQLQHNTILCHRVCLFVLEFLCWK